MCAVIPIYLMAFGPSRHRAWIRGHWMLLEALGPSWSGGEPKAREPQILYHSRHVGSMPQVVPNKYVLRHVRCMPQVVPIGYHLRHVVSMPQVLANKYHLRHVGNMPQVVPNVCVSGSRVTPFGGLWEAVLKPLGGRFGASGGLFGASWGLLGGSLGRLGGLLGASGGLLWHSWGPLGLLEAES